MESPAQYVAQLEAENRRLSALVERTTRERDEYQTQLHVLADTRKHMTSAASLAAGAATVAINRLQSLKAIVEAAVEWRQIGKTGPHGLAVKKADALGALVDAHIKEVEARS